jgi:carbonyl reductase 1
MSSARIALVTGANQGIGFALVSGLAAQMAPEDLVLLTGRNPARVGEAASAVVRDPAARSRVQGRVLDVTDTRDLAGLATELQQRYGGVDIVISRSSRRSNPGAPRSTRGRQSSWDGRAGSTCRRRSPRSLPCEQSRRSGAQATRSTTR